MKIKYTFQLLFLIKFLTAQTFTELTQVMPFAGTYGGSAAFADVDGDNDQDVLIIGESVAGFAFSKLYSNDGQGRFTELIGTPFESVNNGSVAFVDVDGDNDQDVIITGTNNSGVYLTKLYINDGNGSFTEDTNTPFDNVGYSSIAFADIDGDNDQDLFIIGTIVSGTRIAKLYNNNGAGVFTEVIGTPFEGVARGSIAFADVDGDNDQDVITTGFNNSGTRIAKLYINDGTGGYAEQLGTPFPGVDYSSIAFADVDGDNDQDIFITGITNQQFKISHLYSNDGFGNYNQSTGIFFEPINHGSIAFADVDGDNDQDLVITGANNSFDAVSNFYINDGMGNFSAVTPAPFEKVKYSSISFVDVDADNDQDILVTGLPDGSDQISKLYTNDGTGSFNAATTSPFEGVSAGSLAFTDGDGDNDLDVLITGRNNSSNPTSQLYNNDGTGNFTASQAGIFEEVFHSSIAFADIDGDNDQDILITGEMNSGRTSKLYTNNGTGNFTEVPGTPFEDVESGSIAFTDVDGDNDQDVFITGLSNTGFAISKLYKNNGLGDYTEVTNTPFEVVYHSSIACADIDGDNDQDLLITGIGSSGFPISKLYENNGTGNFTEVPGTPFDGVWLGSIAFADVDGDNDQDVLITGDINSSIRIAKLYTNDGAGNYGEVIGTIFDGVGASSIAFADVDGDNDQDVLITGTNISLTRIAKLYTNDGLGNFIEILGTPFEGVSEGSIAFGDIDGDNDQDLILSGLINSSDQILKLYRNDGLVSSNRDLVKNINIKLNLYPNPTSLNSVYVNYHSTTLNPMTLKLYDINSALLLEQHEFRGIGEQIIRVNIKSLNIGNYFVELEEDGAKGFAHFIID